MAAPFSAPLPDPPGAARRHVFVGAESLPAVRRIVDEFATGAGLAADDRAALVLSAHEVAANSVRHGQGGGVLNVWSTDGAVVCEVRDRGRLDVPVGRPRAPVARPARRPRPLARQPALRPRADPLVRVGHRGALAPAGAGGQRKAGITVSPQRRIVSSCWSWVSVPIWMRHMTSSTPASARRFTYAIAVSVSPIAWSRL